MGQKNLGWLFSSQNFIASPSLLQKNKFFSKAEEIEVNWMFSIPKKHALIFLTSDDTTSVAEELVKFAKAEQIANGSRIESN